MIGRCKKCDWPWHMYGNNKPTFCDNCYQDPMTEYAPLVLFDQIGLNMGAKIMLAVRARPGVDAERFPR